MCCDISGAPQDLWQLHHVSLDVKKKFRVVFEGTKVGPGNPTGGMSLDDINLSETTCPEFVWRVKNFKQVMENTPTNTSIFSPPFTSKEGYTFQMQLYPNGKDNYAGELSAYAHLVAREGDAGQKWPCPWKQITMMLMDQHPHIQKRMSNQRSVTTDPNMKGTGDAAFIQSQFNDAKHLRSTWCCGIAFISPFQQHPFEQIQTCSSGMTPARWALKLQIQMGPSTSGVQALEPRCI